MNFLRPSRLIVALVCLQSLTTTVPFALCQQPPAPTPAPASPTPQAPATQAPKPQSSNPFETVPQTEAPKPQQQPQAPVTAPPQFETPKPAEPTTELAGPALAANVIETIQFRGARRVPQDTLRAIIFSKVGDVYNEDTLRRDFIALWNTNRFDDITLQEEKGERGGVVITFVVVERPVIRDIKYEGLKSAST